MYHEVFISYSTHDQKQAHDVLARLEARGIRCWIAPRDILPSDDFAASIDAAIAGSRVFILILSGSSNTSQFVKRELEIAVTNRATIIPFRIEDITLSSSLRFFLSTIQLLDAFAEPREAQLEKLAETVGLLLRRIPGKPEQPLEPSLFPGPTRPHQGLPPPSPLLPARRPLGARLWIAVAIVAIVSALMGVAVIYHLHGARPASAVDPCDPNEQPESEPAMPAEFPAADAEHPLLPPDSNKTTSSVVIRNETGKPLRIWRHVYRPKGSPERDNWRWWLSRATEVL